MTTDDVPATVDAGREKPIRLTMIESRGFPGQRAGVVSES